MELQSITEFGVHETPDQVGSDEDGGRLSEKYLIDIY